MNKKEMAEYIIRHSDDTIRWVEEERKRIAERLTRLNIEYTEAIIARMKACKILEDMSENEERF